MNLLIRNGRIIDPSTRTDRIGDILIANGKIADIGEQLNQPGADCTLMDAPGKIVCPGFVDLHCHLREPGFEDKETIATGTRAAARGGFTTVCCMPNTEPPITTPAIVQDVFRRAQFQSIVRVLPIGAITDGRNGQRLADMPAMAKAGAVGFSDDGSPVANRDLMRQALLLSRECDLLIIDHCEDPSLAGDGSMNAGSVANRLGYKGIPAAAEELMVARDIELARETGGRIHIAHVSTAGSVELIRKARQHGVRITAEVTPHHLTLTEERVLTAGANAKVNPPLRSQQDVDALIAALREGVIDAIATDHAPHTRADKARDFASAAFGISGFETAVGSLMALVHRGQLDLMALVSRLTWEPARIIGIAHHAGTLAKGSPADIVIIDPSVEWQVDPATFASKGRNTPLAGTVLTGRVISTFVGGQVVYPDAHEEGAPVSRR